MKPGDRLVCALVEPLPTGAQFKEWPLHVTVVPWFRVDKSSKELARYLQAALVGMRPFEAETGTEKAFGYLGRKTVNLIVEPTPFREVEYRVRELLKQNDAWLVDETTKRKRQFRPHVTVQVSGGLSIGQKFTVNSLYIIEQKGGHKEVAAAISLS